MKTEKKVFTDESVHNGTICSRRGRRVFGRLGIVKPGAGVMKVERDGDYWDMGHWEADFSGPPRSNGFPGGYQNGRYVSMRSPFLPIVAFWEHYGASVIVWGFDLEQWVLSGVHVVGRGYEKDYGILPWAFGRFPAGDRLAGKYSNDDLLNGLFVEYFEKRAKEVAG